MAYTAQKVVSILFVLMIILLPMGWILVSNEPPGPYFATENSRVEEALKSSGLSVCDQTATKWDVNGALGGYTYVVSKDCYEQDPSSTALIHTQNFDTVQNRDSAIQLIQKSINRDNINGAVYSYGSYVIAIQGPTGGKPVTEAIASVKAALKK